ncbi:MAG: hypothetical protein V1702_05690 [Candidatus Woesearchaeota archaeon]
MTKKLLLGLHDPGMLKTYEMYLEDDGFSVSGVSSLEGMLEKMGIPEDAEPNMPPANPFDAYIMDANLGDFAGSSCEPALRIYRHVKQSVEEKGVKFMSVTGSDEAFSAAKKHGIPVMLKRLDLAENLTKFLYE